MAGGKVAAGVFRGLQQHMRSPEGLECRVCHSRLIDAVVLCTRCLGAGPVGERTTVTGETIFEGSRSEPARVTLGSPVLDVEPTIAGIAVLVVGILLVLAGGVHERVTVVWVGGLMLCELTFAGALGWMALRWTDVRVDFPRRAHARTGRVLPVRLRGPGWLPVDGIRLIVTVADTLSLERPVSAPATEGSTAVLEVLAQFRRRGRYVEAIVELELAILGLVVARRTRMDEIDVTVLPTVRVARRRAVPPGSPLSATGDRVIDRPGHDVEPIGLREYVPGDSPRSVDWRAFARTGALHVKERARASETDVILAVDLLPDAGADERARALITEHLDDAGCGGAGATPLEEELVTIAATLSAHLTRRGQRVGLMLAAAEPVVVAPGTGEVHQTRILTALTLGRAPSRPVLPTLLLAHGKDLGSSSRLLVLRQGPTGPALTVILETLGRRGVDVRVGQLVTGASDRTDGSAGTRAVRTVRGAIRPRSRELPVGCDPERILESMMG